MRRQVQITTYTTPLVFEDRNDGRGPKFQLKHPPPNRENERTYSAWLGEDTPERTEALQFFRDRGISAEPEPELPALMQSLLIDEANEYLRHNPIQANLRYLSISWKSGVGDDDLRRLHLFPELEILKLQFCPITDEGVKKLLHLPVLEVLVLYSREVTDACLDTICRLPRLRSLDMQECPQVSASLLRKVAAGMPCKPEVWVPRERP
jgi:Leucine Rich repeat